MARTLNPQSVPRKAVCQCDTDFVVWADETAQAIHDGRWTDVDRYVVADEISALARSDRRLIRSNLKVLLLHLLKQRYQPNKSGRSWERSILNARQSITQLVDESPSLRPLLDPTGDAMTQAYSDARKLAAVETRLPLEIFPETPPFSHRELWDVSL